MTDAMKVLVFSPRYSCFHAFEAPLLNLHGITLHHIDTNTLCPRNTTLQIAKLQKDHGLFNTVMLVMNIVPYCLNHDWATYSSYYIQLMQSLLIGAKLYLVPLYSPTFVFGDGQVEELRIYMHKLTQHIRGLNIKLKLVIF